MKAWERIFGRMLDGYAVVVVRTGDGERKVAVVYVPDHYDFNQTDYRSALHGPWLLGATEDRDEAEDEATRQAQRLDLELVDRGEKFQIDKTYSTLV